MRAMQMVSGRAVPLDRSDVDTDQIIPSDWLKRVERTGFGAGLFAEWRDDRDFVLNREEYAGATILVAGPNFGTGSSREHAVWALQDYGFDAVVSPRFGDIFRNNCTKAGLVPVQVDPLTGRLLLDAVMAEPAMQITIDIERGTLEALSAGIEDGVPDGRVHPGPAAQRLGRHRPHPALRGRDRGLRGHSGRLAADHPLSGASTVRCRSPRAGGLDPGRESPPGPRRRPPRGAGGQPASGDPVDEELRSALCPSQLRTWRSPLVGGGGRLSRSTSHRDKRYTKGSAETRTAGLRGWSITLGNHGSLTLCRSFRPVHVWISPSGPPLCHNTTFRPGGFPVLLPSWYARAAGRVNDPAPQIGAAQEGRRPMPRRVTGGLILSSRRQYSGSGWGPMAGPDTASSGRAGGTARAVPSAGMSPGRR